MPTDDDSRTSQDSSTGDRSALRRRTFLATGAATLVGSGCVQQSQSLVDRTSPNRPRLTIKTLPADADARATTIARYLSERLATVGIDARVTLLSREELYRDVLLNQSFDLYVARHPQVTDPDVLRPLLHSRFGGVAGWQNPFGYTNLEVDEWLDTQRTESGAARVETLRKVERAVVRDLPFTVVAFPEEIRTRRADDVTSHSTEGPRSALRYLAVEPTAERDEPGGPDAERHLRVTLADSRVTQSLNPLAVEFRNGRSITDLLYDAVGRRIAGRIRPWAATDWAFRETARGPEATITLREDLTWHDGSPLTAADVAFSYRFLRDTSLGTAETPIPAPAYRGRTALVDDVEARTDTSVVVQFRPVNRRVARRAFTVPILPEHIWQRRHGQATVAGVDTSQSVTKALVANNMRPIGSGPLQFERASSKESLVLRRFDEHFLHEGDETDAFGPYAGGFEFDLLTFVVVPSTQAAVELVRRGAADVTGSPLSHTDVPRIGRTDGMALRVSLPRAFYHVGFNARTPPTSNARFRRGVSHLVDKAYIADEFFGGYAEPAATPLARSEVQAPELAWNGTDPSTPFVGTNGRLDVERAREKFREAGYRYSDRGELLMQ
jgi:peptide/nickel transport system substrate-binding protein